MVSLLLSVDTLAQAIIGSLASSLYLLHSREENSKKKKAFLTQLAESIARDSYIKVKALSLTLGTAASKNLKLPRDL